MYATRSKYLFVYYAENIKKQENNIVQHSDVPFWNPP